MKKAKQILAIKGDDDDRLRSMVVIKDLIPKMLDNFKVRTFRPRAYRHKLYQVYCTSYPNRRCEHCPHCVIEMQEVRQVRVDDIKNAWARDAGCKDRKDLLARLKGWYGNDRKWYYMHSFKLLDARGG